MEIKFNSTDNQGSAPTKGSLSAQFSTFYIANRLYGIEVKQVQEIVRPMDMTTIPLAPNYVRGLINLRGQVATALGLRELFNISETPPDHLMNVVCKYDGSLISFQVDEIGDVIEVIQSDFEKTPQTIPEDVRRFMGGVYKVNEKLLSIIDINKIMEHLNDSNRKIKERVTQSP